MFHHIQTNRRPQNASWLNMPWSFLAHFRFIMKAAASSTPSRRISWRTGGLRDPSPPITSNCRSCGGSIFIVTFNGRKPWLLKFGVRGAEKVQAHIPKRSTAGSTPIRDTMAKLGSCARGFCGSFGEATWELCSARSIHELTATVFELPSYHTVFFWAVFCSFLARLRTGQTSGRCSYTQIRNRKLSPSFSIFP